MYCHSTASAAFACSRVDSKGVRRLIPVAPIAVPGHQAADDPVRASDRIGDDPDCPRPHPFNRVLTLGLAVYRVDRGGRRRIHDLVSADKVYSAILPASIDVANVFQVGSQLGWGGPDQSDHVHRIFRGLFCAHLLPLPDGGGQNSG